ncbi:MAG: radical SAM family heme chaperone HemW, partial [Bacteroidota bacterium]
MPGVYLHIPYCRKACTYCDFQFLTQLKQKGEMAQALAQEAALRQDFFGQAVELDTLYIGGGTPSVLSPEELETLLTQVQQIFPLKAGGELTLEANPDDLTQPYLEALQTAGVNRLSIGIQSFDAEDLRQMNRSHTAEQAMACVNLAKDAGITNVSVDLIFGLPGRNLSDWEANVQQAIELGVPHLSVYALSVEQKTVLHHQVEKGKVVLPGDESYAAQFLHAHEWLTAAGYEHYELSSYALPGMRSRHNSSYWKGEPYLGLGPSAHAYDGQQRYWNLANNARYLQHLQH